MEHVSEELKAYYAALPQTGGRDALCKMDIPKELHGKTALDVACRRGKGVYKLAEQVGKHGRAIGADWRPDLLDDARAGQDHALQKAGLTQNNMDFVEAYPETLAQVIGQSVVDFAYVNCVLNLFCDPVQALAQIRSVLKPGGLLVCDTVLATRPRTKDAVARARELGNAVQAAPHRKDFMSWLASAGFDIASIDAVSGEKVDPSLDADGAQGVPVAEDDEPTSFVATSVRVYAPDGIDRHGRRLLKDISEFR